MEKLITALLLLTFLPPIAPAQDGRQLLEIFRQAAQEKEPDWTPIRQQSSHEATLTMAFSYNRALPGVEAPVVLITAEIAESVDSAEARFREASQSVASRVGRRGAKGKKIELKGLGAEGMSYPSLLPGMAGITFRSGQVNVHIDASSEEAARRFADLIAGALAAP
jgi:hypothetical protein